MLGYLKFIIIYLKSFIEKPFPNKIKIRAKETEIYILTRELCQ